MSSPSSRTPTLQALFDVAHKNPGGVTYATPGLGTTQHLTGELFAARAKIELTPAPYRGSAAAMTDVAAGRVDFAITALGTQGGEIQAGRYKVLAVTSKARLPSMPQVPTVAETLPGFEVVTWMGLAVPARTPATIVEQISRDVREVMAIPAVRERFAGLGADPQSSTPAEFQARVEADIARWKELIATRKLNLSQ
jgi:tripartite-type tricarboxylate transporter receptor subunit TctC